MIHIDKTT